MGRFRSWPVPRPAAKVVAITGLAAGDQVITGQLQKLKPGMPVDPAEGRGSAP